MAKTILVLAANPKNTPRLRLDQEVREIDEGLKRAPHRDLVLHQVWAARHSDVRRAMLEYRPNIVHFSGHGAGDEGIAFEDETGNAKLVDAEALADFFELFANTVECVVLNACYSERQADAIAKHIDYVIGMQGKIGDTAAIEFAVAFYDALAAGESVAFAYRLACNAIKWIRLPEQLVPILKSKKHSPKPPVLEQQTEQPVSRSLRIMVTGGRQTTSKVLHIAHLIGEQVVLRGHILMSNGSTGVDTSSAQGASEVCSRSSLDPALKIQVFRPKQDRFPEFDFGKLHVVGTTYAERRNIVIEKSDAIILLGGGDGTRKVANQAQRLGKPLVPVGIGNPKEVAVEWWYKMWSGLEDFHGMQLERADLERIGFNPPDLHSVAVAAVQIVEKFVRD